MGKDGLPVSKSKFTVVLTIEETGKTVDRICEELELGRFDSEDEARQCMTEILEDSGYEEEESEEEEENEKTH